MKDCNGSVWVKLDHIRSILDHLPCTLHKLFVHSEYRSFCHRRPCMGWRRFGLKLRISTLSSHWVAISFSLVRSRSDDIPFWTRPDSNLFDWMAAYRKISMSDGDSVGWKPCRMTMVLKLSSRRLPEREDFNGKCWRKTIGRTFKLSKVNKIRLFSEESSVSSLVSYSGIFQGLF